MARIAFTSGRTGKPSSTPLDTYPRPVLEAITVAALSDVQAIARRITSGEELASRGQDPERAGWWDPANRATPGGADEPLSEHVRHSGPAKVPVGPPR